MLNVIITFTIIICCLAVTWCSENSTLSKPKWGAQAAIRGARPPVATALVANMMLLWYLAPKNYPILLYYRYNIRYQILY